jgi:hypothetical protein
MGRLASAHLGAHRQPGIRPLGKRKKLRMSVCWECPACPDTHTLTICQESVTARKRGNPAKAAPLSNAFEAGLSHCVVPGTVAHSLQHSVRSGG